MKVLWIDDQASADDAIVRWLSMEGIHVEWAKNGRDGIGMAATGRYDALILDLRLPDMHGLRVLEEVHRITPTNNVVVLTGFAEQESVEAVRRMGAKVVLSKPSDVDELLGSLWSLHLSENGSADRSDSLHATVGRAVFQALEGSSETPDPHWRDDTLNLLIWALTHKLLRPSMFLGCSSAFRCIVTSDSSRDLVCKSAREAVARWETLPWRYRDPMIINAIGCLQHRPRAWSEQRLAKRLAISPTHLGRRVRNDAGLTFRQLRLIVTMPRAVRQLAWGERCSQTAWSLGYSHASEFTREFTQMFGISPRQFARRYSGQADRIAELRKLSQTEGL